MHNQYKDAINCTLRKVSYKLNSLTSRKFIHLNKYIYKKMEKIWIPSYLFNSNQSSPYESMRHAHSYGQFKR